MSESIFEVVRAVLVEVRDLDPSKVSLESLLIDDLGADSLDAIEIIMALEEHYDRELDDIDVESLKTVGDIVSLIESIID